MSSTALQMLILSAQLAGIDTRPLLPPVSASAIPASEEPRRILSLSLADVARDQDRAYAGHQVGRERMDFSVGLDPEPGLWIKFRQQGHAVAHPLAALAKGVEENFPVEPYRFLYENGLVRAYPLRPPQEPQANVSPAELLRLLYRAARMVLLGPLEHAVIYEDGSLLPASVSLIREDRAGRFLVIHRTLGELQDIQWFALAEGTAYGMRVEGNELVFYSRPAPGLSLRPAGLGLL